MLNLFLRFLICFGIKPIVLMRLTSVLFSSSTARHQEYRKVSSQHVVNSVKVLSFAFALRGSVVQRVIIFEIRFMEGHYRILVSPDISQSLDQSCFVIIENMSLRSPRLTLINRRCWKWRSETQTKTALISLRWCRP